jgi:hypothetical protein
MMAKPNERLERIVEINNNYDMHSLETDTKRPQYQLPFNVTIWSETSSDTEYTSESSSYIECTLESSSDTVRSRRSSLTFHTWLPENEQILST